jgi:transposase
MLDDLTTFIRSNPDPRELKRAIAVQNDPTQNPIEDIWLAAKWYIREFYHQCKTFTEVKYLFELAVQHQIFDFPKLHRLGEFSLIT